MESNDESRNVYSLETLLDSGTFSNIYLANSNSVENGTSPVAIKTFPPSTIRDQLLSNELQILTNLTAGHPGLIDFLGLSNSPDGTDVWLVLEFCEGGPVDRLVNGLLAHNRRMAEEHIAYILKEIAKALIYLHKNDMVHGDVKLGNILLTKCGEIKLCDFGQSRSPKSTVWMGSPSWMPPEMITLSDGPDNDQILDCRTDVWSFGITAIELGDGCAPYESMYPSRILFQIRYNPPPTLNRPSNWSIDLVDFITECLTQQLDYRPYMEELLEHPFLIASPENNYYLGMELVSLASTYTSCVPFKRRENVIVEGNLVKFGDKGDFEVMTVEDLAALPCINEDRICSELKKRFELNQLNTFIGDILLCIHSNFNERNLDDIDTHVKYRFKSRSDNMPHIYAIADGAYQNALHTKLPQKILLSGESASGKTKQYLDLMDHLYFLGHNSNINMLRLRQTVDLIQFLIRASTPHSQFSTRAVLNTVISFGQSGKVTATAFNLLHLEKTRVSHRELSQSNYHFLYYIYEGLKSLGQTTDYHLDTKEKYQYLLIRTSKRTSMSLGTNDSLLRFQQIQSVLESFEFPMEQIETIFKIVSSILLLGEVIFEETIGGCIVVKNLEILSYISDLLQIEQRMLRWALVNYCTVVNGEVIKKRRTLDDSLDGRNVLANNLYARMVNFLINTINERLSLGKHIFGEKFTVSILDYFGFESLHRNGLQQMIINCYNEQFHYHYLQRVFSWEYLDWIEEKICPDRVQFYENKTTLDLLLGKSFGLFSILTLASKTLEEGNFICKEISKKKNRYVKSTQNFAGFSVAHYAGRVEYDPKDMPLMNRDFLRPEIVQTLQRSGNCLIRRLFNEKIDGKGVLLPFDLNTGNGFNSKSSQVKMQRTISSSFRSMSLEILKELVICKHDVNAVHYVRCIRSNLNGRGEDFQESLVRNQIKTMAIVETAKTRQSGYSVRITFEDFLERYKFLAFDFDENVEISKENCRLLLLRLKMEDWAIGESKVFLKYYNEEYLARLYESQIKKIVKIQSTMRAFLAKCLMRKKQRLECKVALKEVKFSEDMRFKRNQAACIIQRVFKNVTLKRKLRQEPVIWDQQMLEFTNKYFQKWKIFKGHRDTSIQKIVKQTSISSESISESILVSESDLADNFDTLSEIEEMWDAPYESLRNLPEDVTKDLQSSKMKQSNFIHCPFSRESQDNAIEDKSNTIEGFIKLKHIEKCIQKPELCDNEYIVKETKRVNPVVELKMISRRQQQINSGENDEPPFNFQAMLRKTNYRRDSLKDTIKDNCDALNKTESSFQARKQYEFDHRTD